MQIENQSGALDGEARRHLQTLSRRRWYVIVPLLIGLLVAIQTGRGGEETFVTRSIVRVPDPTKSSVFTTGQSESNSSETDRIIASAIQLIKGNEVSDIVTAELGQDRFDEITLLEITSLEDTLFINILVGSRDPDVAVDASLSYANSYVAEQARLDVSDLRTRADQLRDSADTIDTELMNIDDTLRGIEREIVIRDFEIRALEAQLDIQGRVPQNLVDLTIERNDFDREKEIQLGERGRKSQEQTFLRQEASNLDIEASYRLQTGAQIVSPPETPTLLSTQSLPQNMVIYGLLGALLGVAVALVAEYFDSRIKSMRDLHDLAPNIPIVGAVPKMASMMSRPHLAVVTGRPWYAAEAYRALRTTLLAKHSRQHNAFVFSSVGAGAGKSVTVANLAAGLAQSGFRVLVIDANLRRPSIHMKLGVNNEAGVAQLLGDWVEPTEMIQRSELDDELHVIPAGPVPDNPAELLGLRSMARLLRWGKERYDWVLVDSPPLDVFTDATVLAHRLGGVFVVVRFQETDHRRLSEVLDQMEIAGVPVLGFVVNGRDPTESRARRYARGIGIRNLRTLWTDRPINGGRLEAAPPPIEDFDEEETAAVDADPPPAEETVVEEPVTNGAIMADVTRELPKTLPADDLPT